MAEHFPVTEGVAGSSPVVRAFLLRRFNFLYNLIMTDSEPTGEANRFNLKSMIDRFGQVNQFLRPIGISPILYGSVGVGVYLGDFKKFDDLDILIEDKWLGEDFPEFTRLLDENGFRLVDAKEHEFESEEKFKLNFSTHGILIRDGIADLTTDTVSTSVNGIKIRTLTPTAFTKAYEFSVKDGYRKKTRGKKDAEVINKLKHHIECNK